mgnify:FL=1|jgi:hypothetical protein
MNDEDLKRRLLQSRNVDSLVTRLMPTLARMGAVIDELRVMTLADRRALRRLVVEIHPLGEDRFKAVYGEEIIKARAELAANHRTVPTEGSEGGILSH